MPTVSIALSNGMVLKLRGGKGPNEGKTLILLDDGVEHIAEAVEDKDELTRGLIISDAING
jgi:hypothetical protein